MIMPDYSSEVKKRFYGIDPKVNCPEITFQVTDDCCLNCSYCYQINKAHNMMSKQTGKNIVDLLFKMYDENKEDALINNHTKGIVLSFIGGEPFMNIEVMNYIMDYFMNQCFLRDHVWLTNFRVEISSNGMLYFQPEVQEFLNKYRDFISLTITLDGPKEVHDTCRVDYNGKGSVDQVITAWKDWNKINPNINTKITISPENLSQISNIFDFFIQQGCTAIFSNPIFEHNWTVEEGQQYYQILKKLADVLLENDNVFSSLFIELCGKPLPSKNTSNWCGGTGAMLAFDPFGNAYPCLRYMSSSLGKERAPLIIGNTEGVYNTPEYQAIYQDMKQVTRQSQSSEECIDCQIAMGCAYCSAYNYQATGSYNKRLMNICWMHRARSLANSYYWNKYYRKHNISKRFPVYLSHNIAKSLISDEEYDLLLELAEF